MFHVPWRLALCLCSVDRDRGSWILCGGDGIGRLSAFAFAFAFMRRRTTHTWYFALDCAIKPSARFGLVRMQKHLSSRLGIGSYGMKRGDYLLPADREAKLISFNHLRTSAASSWPSGGWAWCMVVSCFLFLCLCYHLRDLRLRRGTSQKKAVSVLAIQCGRCLWPLSTYVTEP